MSEFTDFNTAGLVESIAVMGEPVTIATQSFTGVVSDVALSEELGDGGISESRGLSIVIQRTGTFVPKIGDLAGFDGKSFRVLDVAIDETSWTLTLNTDEK